MENSQSSDAQLDSLSLVLLGLVSGDGETARHHLQELAPEAAPTNDRRSVDMKTQAQVFARDGYICRYCARRTVCLPALRYISCCFPDLFPYDPHWKWNATHPLYYEVCASCDHVIPVARQGSNSLNNLVTSCYRCNSRKSNYLLSELGMELLPINRTEWDGLVGLFVRAYTSHLRTGSPVVKRLEKWDRDVFDKWLAALMVAGSVPAEYQAQFDF